MTIKALPTDGYDPPPGCRMNRRQWDGAVRRALVDTEAQRRDGHLPGPPTVLDDRGAVRLYWQVDAAGSVPWPQRVEVLSPDREPKRRAPMPRTITTLGGNRLPVPVPITSVWGGMLGLTGIGGADAAVGHPISGALAAAAGFYAGGGMGWLVYSAERRRWRSIEPRGDAQNAKWVLSLLAAQNLADQISEQLAGETLPELYFARTAIRQLLWTAAPLYEDGIYPVEIHKQAKALAEELAAHAKRVEDQLPALQPDTRRGRRKAADLRRQRVKQVARVEAADRAVEFARLAVSDLKEDNALRQED